MTASNKLESTFSIAYPIVLFLLTFFISGYFSFIGADPLHDGIMFKPAMDVASGQMLFRDTFTQYGALSTLLQAASLIIFGKYLITIKLLTAFFYALIAMLLYLIFMRFLPKTIVFITLIIWIFMAPYYIVTFLPWSSVYSLFFQLLGACFILISITKNSQQFLLLSGVATSLTFWCRQPVGVFMFIAILIFFIYLYFLRQMNLPQLKNKLTIYILGNFLASFPFVLWLLANHAFNDWWLQSVVFAYSFNQRFDGGFSLPKIINSLFTESFSPLSVWVLLPLSTIFLFMAHSIKLFHKSQHVISSTNILVLCFIGLSSWLQYYPVNCIRHVYWAGTPMFCLFAISIFQFLDKLIFENGKIPTAIIGFASIILILLAFSPDLMERVKCGYRIVNQSYYSIDQPEVLKHMRLNNEEVKNYKYIYSEIDSYLKKNPGGNVVNLSGDALYNTFNPKILNVHQIYINWATLNPIYPDYYPKTFSYISENRPLILTTDPVLIPENYFQLQKPENTGKILIYRAWPQDQN